MHVDTSRTDGLLPGEAFESDELDDAAHWATVYEELVGFLRETHPRTPNLERYQRRLAYWRGRCRQTAAARGPLVRKLPD